MLHSIFYIIFIFYSTLKTFYKDLLFLYLLENYETFMVKTKIFVDFVSATYNIE